MFQYAVSTQTLCPHTDAFPRSEARTRRRAHPTGRASTPAHARTAPAPPARCGHPHTSAYAQARSDSRTKPYTRTHTSEARPAGRSRFRRALSPWPRALDPPGRPRSPSWPCHLRSHPAAPGRCRAGGLAEQRTGRARPFARARGPGAGHVRRGGYSPSRCSRWGWAEAPWASLCRRSGSWWRWHSRSPRRPGKQQPVSPRPARRPEAGPSRGRKHLYSCAGRTSARPAVAARCDWLAAAGRREPARLLPARGRVSARTGPDAQQNTRNLPRYRPCAVPPVRSAPLSVEKQRRESTWNRGTSCLSYVIYFWGEEPFSSGVRSYWGPNMSFGFTHWSNWSDVRNPSLTAASFNVVPSLWAVLAILAALSYPGTTQHKQVGRLQRQKVWKRWEQSETLGLCRTNLLNTATTA